MNHRNPSETRLSGETEQRKEGAKLRVEADEVFASPAFFIVLFALSRFFRNCVRSESFEDSLDESLDALFVACVGFAA